MKNNFTYRLFYLLAIAFLMLLINSCSLTRKTKQTKKTTKTTIIEWDSTVISPARKATFFNDETCCDEPIILKDKKTGIELKITKQPDINSILAYFRKNKTPDSNPNKDLNNKNESKSDEKTDKEDENAGLYKYEITVPEEEIPINGNKTVIEEEETETETPSKPIPWYYKWAFQFVIFLFVLAIMIFLLKRFRPWQRLKL